MTEQERDFDLDTLLLLDGEVFPMENGYWTKFEVKKIEPNKYIPQGIKYSLTLHDRNNVRVVGYDNSHAIKPKKRKYGAKRMIWDHKHKQKSVEPYEYGSAGELLEDFWDDVNRVLKKIRR